jgi:hypothetical protein
MTSVLVVGLLALLLTGCARDTRNATDLTQQEAAREAQDYRGEAYELWEMADRRDREAELLANDLGPDDPKVRQKRDLAQELRAAAREMEQKGRVARQQVPHGMVQ